jgi:predicted AlkP superfamily pyrophosphatase or phosphodiesterase
LRRALGAALAALLACAAAQAEPRVILLSWDGVRHDQPDRGSFPALARMQREGARAERLVPVYPSSTFPNHVSLATGTYPDRHGIVDNEFFDRERGAFDREADAGWIQAEPLWAAAERQNLPSAVYYWVGSETPWHGVAARRRMAPFDAGVPEANKVEALLDWVEQDGPDRPRLMLAWWHGTDRDGHLNGPDDASVGTALAGQDAELAKLLAGLDARDAWADTTLLIVSDHGMTVASESVPFESALEAAGVSARSFGSGAVAQLFLADPAQVARAEAALAPLAGIRVWRRGAVPAELRLNHATRSGDLTVAASPPYALKDSPVTERAARALSGGKRGLHGYDPSLSDMGGIFFARGRGVKAGTKLGAVRAVDVAATVARLLGMAPPANSEGSPITGLGD